jgi:hypothetical protein
MGEASMFIRSLAVAVTLLAVCIGCNRASAVCPYDYNCLNNPYGAGSSYAPNGFMNPYSPNGSPYSNNSWTNPYATNPPKIYDQNGQYHGNFSSNPYDPNSTSNPYGRYGSPYSPDSLNNPYGAGNPYSTNRYYVVPSE